VREEDSSSQSVNSYITGICTKGAFTEVSISTGASFFISDDDYLKFSFAKGDSVSSDVLEQLELGHKIIVCRKKALDLLSLTEHSAFTLSTKLRQRGFEADTIRLVLAELEEKKYLDDRRFARIWVSSRLKKNPAGRSILVAGLRAKGISQQDAEDVVAELVDDEALLVGAARVYEKLSKKKNAPLEKIIQGMLQKGYSMSIIRKVSDKELE